VYDVLEAGIFDCVESIPISIFGNCTWQLVACADDVVSHVNNGLNGGAIKEIWLE
jgi:hypothetical protein